MTKKKTPESITQEGDENPPATEGTEETLPDSKGWKKHIVKIAIAFVVLLVASVGGYFTVKSSLFSKKPTKHHEKTKVKEELKSKEELKPEDLEFITLPEMIVNLKSDKNQINILRASFFIAVNKKDREVIDKLTLIYRVS